jgi:hypothetical protein
MTAPAIAAAGRAIEVATDMDLMYLEAALAFELNLRNREPEPDYEADGWDPWEALRRRRGIAIEWTEEARAIGGGGLAAYSGRPGCGLISLAHPRRTRTSEAWSLTHELIHIERGIGVCDDAGRILRNWTPEERAVEEAVVRRLTRERMAFYRPARWARPEEVSA